MPKLISLLLVISVLFSAASYGSSSSMEKFSMKFNTIQDFEKWLNENGHDAKLGRVYRAKNTDLWVLDREGGEFIIDGEETICGLFDSEKTWDYYPKFIKDLGEAGNSPKEPVITTYYNVRCMTAREKKK